MKLELPDNNASVLFHMGNALQSIASDLDAAYTQNPDKVWELANSGHKVTRTETVGDVSHSVTVEPIVESGLRYGTIDPSGKITMINDAELSDAINDMTDAIAAEHEIPVNRLLGESDTIDADGLPWDQRIHSRGKTRLADNTWRMARKPNDKSDEEWTEYVEGVKTELKALMAIPVAVTYDPNEADPFAIEPPVVDAVVTPPVVDATDVNGVEFRQLSGEIHNVEINGTFEAVANGDIVAGQPVRIVTPPIVIEAPEVVTPPVVDAVVTPPVVDVVVTPPPVSTGPSTFPELMKFITVNNKKLTKESVDEALKAQGLASIALLAARTDLIPQVHAALVKLL